MTFIWNTCCWISNANVQSVISLKWGIHRVDVDCFCSLCRSKWKLRWRSWSVLHSDRIDWLSWTKRRSENVSRNQLRYLWICNVVNNWLHWSWSWFDCTQTSYIHIKSYCVSQAWICLSSQYVDLECSSIRPHTCYYLNLHKHACHSNKTWRVYKSLRKTGSWLWKDPSVSW